MNRSLFEMAPPAPLSKDILGADTAVLAGFALDAEEELLSSLKDVIERSPFRNMVTPGGFRMSVAMSNCGSLGWVTDRTGYRYDEIDPEVNRPWPAMPTAFQKLAVTAAEEAGFSNFVPDACLINRYEPGSRLSLHQDKNERDFTQAYCLCLTGTARNLPLWWFGARGRSATHSCHTWRCSCLGRFRKAALSRHCAVEEW
jgi:DNA oxidative demethylase